MDKDLIQEEVKDINNIITLNTELVEKYPNDDLLKLSLVQAKDRAKILEEFLEKISSQEDIPNDINKIIQEGFWKLI